MKAADQEIETSEGAALCPPPGASCCESLKFLLLFPILFPLKLTLPDVKVGGKEYWYPVTLVGAVAWVGFASRNARKAVGTFAFF